jgi:hypothetical protein
MGKSKILVVYLTVVILQSTMPFSTNSAVLSSTRSHNHNFRARREEESTYKNLPTSPPKMKLITTATLVVSTLLVHGTIIVVRAGENTIRGGGDNGDGDRPSQSSSSSSSSGQRDLAPVYLLEQPLFGVSTLLLSLYALAHCMYVRSLSLSPLYVKHAPSISMLLSIIFLCFG